MPSRRSRLMSVCVLLSLLFSLPGCQGRECESSEAAAHGSQQLIQDATHNAGNKSFFWLFPVVKPPVPRGNFDSTLSPIVKIDEMRLDGQVVRTVATFSRTTGRGERRMAARPLAVLRLEAPRLEEQLPQGEPQRPAALWIEPGLCRPLCILEITMRIRGRRLFPDNLRERRLMMQMGSTPLYAPRGVSPYVIARRLSRAASSEGLDIEFVRGLLVNRPRQPTQPKLATQQPGTTSAPTSVAA